MSHKSVCVIVLAVLASTVPATAIPFVYVANSFGGDVSAYSLDPATGVLTPLAGSPFSSGGSGTGSVTVHPNGRFLYTTNKSSNNLSAFTIDSTGALTAVRGSPVAAATGPS
ncbi:MAG TPA: beta-propeller fold lactonase family protein, partial [Thermoanaerobaculia bacterium]